MWRRICGGRRAYPPAAVRRGAFDFDLASKTLYHGDAALPLTKSEYAICEHLATHAGQVFSKEQIYEAVFGYDGCADDSAVTEHVKNIRAKLKAAGGAPIRNGVGDRVHNGKTKKCEPGCAAVALFDIDRRFGSSTGGGMVDNAHAADERGFCAARPHAE